MTAFEIVRSTFRDNSPALVAFDHFVSHARTAGYVLVPRVKGAVRSIELQWARRRKPFSIQQCETHQFLYSRSVLKEHKGLFAAEKPVGSAR